MEPPMPDFLAGAYDVPGRVFWRASARMWCLIAPIPHAAYAEAFRFHRNSWSPDCMEGAMREMYDSLPPVVTLWRGQPTAFPLGLRWTQYPTYAQTFADKPASALFARDVRKSDVAFISGLSLPEFALFEPPA